MVKGNCYRGCWARISLREVFGEVCHEGVLVFNLDRGTLVLLWLESECKETGCAAYNNISLHLCRNDGILSDTFVTGYSWLSICENFAVEFAPPLRSVDGLWSTLTHCQQGSVPRRASINMLDDCILISSLRPN